MAYLNLTTNEYPLSEHQIRLANPNVSFPAIFKAAGYTFVFDKPKPNIDPITQYVVELPPVEINGHYEQTWEILNFSADIIAENQHTESLRITQRIESNKDSLWKAARDYQENYIQGAAIGLLTKGVILNLPKSILVESWVQSIWVLYQQRKALITDTLDPLFLDFTIVGVMPHSILELMTEIQ